MSEKNSPLNSYKRVKPPSVISRQFGRLKVRQKLAILHNVFFFVLTVSVYLSVIPLFSQHIDAARDRELRMVSRIFVSGTPQTLRQEAAELGIYDFHDGSAQQLALSADGASYLGAHPGGIWQQGQDTLFRSSGVPGLYWRVSLSPAFYDAALRQARISLFVVLGTIYVLSIVVLEFMIMPQYVYQPLRLMLRADEATQRDDRENELIDARFIMNDEIGQIMRSRNATVSQLRRQEDDLASALQKLEEQDRLVSLGLLSTSVAHELNTPLAVLQGSIEKLLESAKGTAACHQTAKELAGSSGGTVDSVPVLRGFLKSAENTATIERLNRMLRVTQRLRKISEGLVDFARVRTHKPEAVALRGLIEESWNLVAIDEKASAVSFENCVRPGDKIVGNPDRLVQVFVNLLRNALLAVSAAGIIRVESKCIQRGGQNWIGCTVLDNGPGIPANILPNLFEAFVTTRLDARGTGLGLTVAEGIVTQHGGTISASNRPDGGASLEVVLPAA